MKNIIGNRYGRLLVLKHHGYDNTKTNTTWLCECDCGKTTIVTRTHLTNGNTKSCGCLALEIRTKHNDSRTRFYRILIGMKGRCLNKNNTHYSYYGGRGITICDEWLEDYGNFKNDMYESYINHVDQYGEENTYIDRIDVDGNYKLSNCRWATKKQQTINRNPQSNQRNFKAISPTGEEYISNNQQQFAKNNNLFQGGIRNCLIGRCSHHKHWTFKYI